MIHIYSLGAAHIEIGRDRHRITPAAAPVRFALLLYLGFEPGRPIDRERLQTLLFPDKPPLNARHCLRQLLYYVRAAGCEISADNTDFVIPPDAVWCDAAHAIAQDQLPSDTIAAIAGGFLPGFAPIESEAYIEWYEALRATTLTALVRRLLAAGAGAIRSAKWDLADSAVRACLAVDPLNEGAHLLRAELVASAGSKAQALALLEDYSSEVGARSADLKLPASLVRRRIGDGLLYSYAPNGAASSDRAAAFALPPFTGRDAELAALHDTLAAARAGNAQCVVVAGEPGIGKTRLVDEFARAAALHGAHVARVVMQPHDADRPMGAFVDAVPNLMRAPGALGCSPASMDALRNLTRQRGEDKGENVADADRHEQRWSAVSRAVADLCEAIASETPLVLVVDDAHWLDALSANAIGRIVGTRSGAPIVVILTTRDSRLLLKELRLTERCRVLPVGPLGTRARDALLGTLMSDDGEGPSSPAALRSRIATVSAGNPLFLILLAAHSRSTNGSLDIPETILDSFTQRIDALTRRARSVLATCAALGKHSTVGRLTTALELRNHELVEALLELTDAGLVLRGEENPVPAHPLVSEALRVRLPEPARQAVAGAVAAALEREADATASPALWWDAAESWEAANNAPKAIQALSRCADHALEIGRPGEAALLLDRALSLRRNEDPACDIARALVRAAYAAHNYSLVLRGAQHVRLSGDLHHDDIEVAELVAHWGLHQTHEETIPRLLACLTAADASPAHRVDAATLLLKCADTTGRMDLRDTAIRSVSPEDQSAVTLLARLEFEQLCKSVNGQRAAAAEVARRILKHCDSEDPAGVRTLPARRSAVTAIHLAGDFHDAICEYRQLFRLSEAHDAFRGQLVAAVQLASLLWDTLQDDEAAEWRSRAIALAAGWPEFLLPLDFATLRVEMALVQREFDEAEAVLEAATPDALGGGSDGIGHRWATATALAIRCGRGALSDADRGLALRIGGNALSSMTGCRDFEVACAAEALMRMGLAAQAADIIRNYMDVERRDAKPPTRFLARVSAGVTCGARTAAASS